MDKRFYLTFGRAAAATLLLIAAQAASAAATAVDEAQTLMGQGQYDQALKKVEGQLKTAPQDAEARFLRGLILVKLNRGPEAIRVFADLTRDYPQLPEPYNNLAVLYAQQGDYEKARDALEAALATHPSYATAHENLGDIYAALAGAAYNRALTLDQSNQLVRSKLALISQLDHAGSAGTAPAIASSSTSTVTAPPAASSAPASIPPASTVPSAAASLDAGTMQNVTSVVNAWAAAWSSKDVSAYFAIYAPSFIPEGSVTRGTWEAQRRDRISRAARISVKALNPRVERVSDDRVGVTFTQDYESDSFTDKVSKTLELQQAGASWLIVREYTR
ncbi:MAG: tetratricopeptide repeat protein [Hydrocarboniphaga sp.]|uniref:tetratricopeptide repeat protein n=1 Tax=Hydrocarboniphaga sp. TaxID=2033016 RepID=UPI0026311F5B|nr:tetratricopeptide repeat protein [Hydrocarboniphaga sp.]MDB5968871.1 tetratricopeptide repeat protein [Hydrocarboniphaga sp.]